jgi:hypothetical protein
MLNTPLFAKLTKLKFVDVLSLLKLRSTIRVYSDRNREGSKQFYQWSVTWRVVAVLPHSKMFWYFEWDKQFLTVDNEINIKVQVFLKWEKL